MAVSVISSKRLPGGSPVVLWLTLCEQGQRQGLVKRVLRHWLPYLAVLTRSAAPMSVLEQAFARTAYEPVRVEGVYSEGDKRTVPGVFYLTWLQRRRASLGKVTGLGAALAALGGTLLLAQRVPANRSERRVPDISFDDARKLQQAGRVTR